jgi:uncharacterized DUF497 family protein
VQIYELIIDPDREDHIARHGVTADEVEQVVFGAPLVLRTRQRRSLLIGQTAAGRYLAVVLGPRERGVFGLITARPADVAERRLFNRQRGR